MNRSLKAPTHEYYIYGSHPAYVDTKGMECLRTRRAKLKGVMYVCVCIIQYMYVYALYVYVCVCMNVCAHIYVLCQCMCMYECMCSYLCFMSMYVFVCDPFHLWHRSDLRQTGRLSWNVRRRGRSPVFAVARRPAISIQAAPVRIRIGQSNKP